MPDVVLRTMIDVERHVAASGWDQEARLFALVATSELLAAEPGLVSTLGNDPATRNPQSLTPVEQEDLPAHSSLDGLLAGIAWPETVTGAAIVVERLMLPSNIEPSLPDDEHAALRFLAEHPQRQEMRLAVGVLRDGRRAGVIRLRAYDRDSSVLTGADLAPGLADALAVTLVD
ncbi:MAG: PPA1309 family protein [Candidatus Nanopelagicales bacterium]